MRRVLLAVAGVAMFAVGPAQATELYAGAKDLHAPAHCRYVTDAYVLLGYAGDRRSLRAEVWRRYEHAAHVANDPDTIYSSSPRFLWANEAKVACAKAYGYLRGHFKWEVNVETVQKCECFHDRMLQYTHAVGK